MHHILRSWCESIALFQEPTAKKFFSQLLVTIGNTFRIWFSQAWWVLLLVASFRGLYSKTRLDLWIEDNVVGMPLADYSVWLLRLYLVFLLYASVRARTPADVEQHGFFDHTPMKKHLWWLIVWFSILLLLMHRFRVGRAFFGPSLVPDVSSVFVELCAIAYQAFFILFFLDRKPTGRALVASFIRGLVLVVQTLPVSLVVSIVFLLVTKIIIDAVRDGINALIVMLMDYPPGHMYYPPLYVSPFAVGMSKVVEYFLMIPIVCFFTAYYRQQRHNQPDLLRRLRDSKL